jgi:hypothetical protein
MSFRINELLLCIVVTIEKCYEGQNLLSFFHCKQRNQLACYVETRCFPFVKIDDCNSKNDINVKKSRNSETIANLIKVYLHFLVQMISPTAFLSIVLEL